jgi:hypothetical protein
MRHRERFPPSPWPLDLAPCASGPRVFDLRPNGLADGPAAP